MALGQKTGGRLKGSRNRSTRLREENLRQALTSENLTPAQLELLQPIPVMLRIMRLRYAAGDHDGALAAASAVAPYTNARLSSSDIRVTHPDEKLSDAELEAEIARLEAKKLAAAKAEETRH